MKCPVCNATIDTGMQDCPSCHLAIKEAKRLNDLAKKMVKDESIPDEVWEELYAFAEWKDGWQIVEYLGSSPTLYLPHTYQGKPVLHVGEYAFDSAPILAVHVPSNIESLGKGAFWHCNLLKYVALADGVRVIGDDCFLGCADLPEIHLPDSIESLGSGCFASCIKLSKVRFPVDLESIPDRMFLDCENMRSIAMPVRLVNLGNQSLEGTSISRLRLPPTSLYIGSRALAATPLRSIVIPDEVEVLGDAVFADCASFGRIRLGSGVQQVGTDCFAYTDLHKIVVARDNVTFRSRRNCLLKGDVMVAGCYASEITEDVNVIMPHAFVGLKGLALDVPEGVYCSPDWMYDCE